MSKYLLKKGMRARVFAISIPSKGIFYCSPLIRTLKICSVSPLISILHSSIDYNTEHINIELFIILFRYGQNITRLTHNKSQPQTTIIARTNCQLQRVQYITCRQKKGLFVLALKHLLEDRRTQEPAYEEITELLASGSLFVANTVN